MQNYANKKKKNKYRFKQNLKIIERVLFKKKIILIYILSSFLKFIFSHLEKDKFIESWALKWKFNIKC